MRTLERPPATFVPQKYVSWLKVVLRNVHLDRVRSAAWRAHAYSDPDALDELPSAAPAEVPAWRAVDPEYLQQCLKRLRPNERRILIMQTHERRSLREIGRALNICPATAATRAPRARLRLRGIICEGLARASDGRYREVRASDTKLTRARPPLDDVPAVLKPQRRKLFPDAKDVNVQL